MGLRRFAILCLNIQTISYGIYKLLKYMEGEIQSSDYTVS